MLKKSAELSELGSNLVKNNMSDLDSFFSEIKQIDTESIGNDERPSKLRKIEGETLIGAAMPSQNTISIVAAAKPSSVFSEELSVSHDQTGLQKTLTLQEKADLYNLMLEGKVVSAKSISDNANISSNSNSNITSITAPIKSNSAAAPPQFVPATGKKFLRAGGGETWVDNTLNEWPANDYRLWVGDITKETTVEHLNKHFSMYPSFAKAKVIHSKKEAKARGYGKFL